MTLQRHAQCRLQITRRCVPPHLQPFTIVTDGAGVAAVEDRALFGDAVDHRHRPAPSGALSLNGFALKHLPGFAGTQRRQCVFVALHRLCFQPIRPGRLRCLFVNCLALFLIALLDFLQLSPKFSRLLRVHQLAGAAFRHEVLDLGAPRAVAGLEPFDIPFLALTQRRERLAALRLRLLALHLIPGEQLRGIDTHGQWPLFVMLLGRRIGLNRRRLEGPQPLLQIAPGKGAVHRARPRHRAIAVRDHAPGAALAQLQAVFLQRAVQFVPRLRGLEVIQAIAPDPPHQALHPGVAFHVLGPVGTPGTPL